MTWLQTIPPSESQGRLRETYQLLKAKHPEEYASPVSAAQNSDGTEDSIVAAHSLIPKTMEHVFSGFAELMSPELPLSRQQQEMINTLVSAINRCHF